MEELILLTIVLVVIVGTVLLQIFLSKKENKSFGLILPMISVFFSIIVVLNLLSPTFAEVLVTFLLANIPTAVLMAIYYAFRSKWKKNKQIEKMNIQDLD
ncbi:MULTISPECIES: hypothetical protein [Bacillaceae]|uniref:Uncharacterized protein n=1 Tax=Evansella alkalicola TaxID=745819 RepID=A0ABS6JT89_9BACI|nr:MULTISPECIES: hypothetical protein [Bacillaceae]MBU9721291.1 hypothetical protein [Bacillus alkalicola]